MSTTEEMDDGNWLRRELQEAEREYAALPDVARPVVVRAADVTASDIDRDPMWHQAYMDVQAVLDKALGTEEEDGAGGGMAADVALLAAQRDRARAEVAELRRTIRAINDAREADSRLPFGEEAAP